MKIVVLDGYLVNHGDLSWEPLSRFGDFTCYDSTAPEEIIGRIGDAQAVFVNRCTLTAAVIAACPKLRYIGTLGTGYNMIDLEAAKAHNILVRNVPGYSSYAVAQATISLLLEVTNQTARFHRYLSEGHWVKEIDPELTAIPQIELCNKTLGLIGVGGIGQRVALIASALGMKVLGCGSTQLPRHPLPDCLYFCALEELLAASDIVSLHCPLSQQTKGLVNQAFLDKLRPGAILLNTARGGLIEVSALVSALDSGHLLAYAADVLETEPPPADHPLLNRTDCILTPHVAWSAKETRQRLISLAGDAFGGAFAAESFDAAYSSLN